MNNTRGIYIENLTAEIFRTLTDVLNPATTDKDFLKAHDRVRAIIGREYVDIADQKREPVRRRGRPKKVHDEEE